MIGIIEMVVFCLVAIILIGAWAIFTGVVTFKDEEYIEDTDLA